MGRRDESILAGLEPDEPIRRTTPAPQFGHGEHYDFTRDEDGDFVFESKQPHEHIAAHASEPHAALDNLLGMLLLRDQCEPHMEPAMQVARMQNSTSSTPHPAATPVELPEISKFAYDKRAFGDFEPAFEERTDSLVIALREIAQLRQQVDKVTGECDRQYEYSVKMVADNTELQHVIAAIREAKIERPELWFYDPAGGCLFRTGLELHHEAVYRYEDADSVFDTAAQKIAALESQLAAKDARIAELKQECAVFAAGTIAALTL